MSRKPTQYPKIIRELKDYMNVDSLTITLSFGRKCLTETLYVSGGWEGNSYSISADINWRSGELKTTEMDVFQLVKLIRKFSLKIFAKKIFKIKKTYVLLGPLAQRSIASFFNARISLTPSLLTTLPDGSKMTRNGIYFTPKLSFACLASSD